MLFERVLVSIDFSQQSKLLLNCVDEFKNYGMKEMILAHIVDIRSAGGNASNLISPNEEKLNKMKQDLKKEGIEVEVVVRIGFPAEELSNISREENASLILAGSHGGGFIKSLFLGSTAFDLLRITDTPLLIERFQQDKGELKPYCRLKFPQVLIATDFSECSIKLLDAVGENRGIFSQIHLLHVIESAPNKDKLEKMKEDARSLLEKIKAGVDGRIEVFTHVQVGDAAKKIIAVAQKEEVNLIMLSKKGHGGAREMLLGSTAQAVASGSVKNAVLVFPC
ncbi:MAG: universal stress protein [Actinomycetia bacterium]|nr:universal stress protein [Actinomycetes bacterium]